MEKGITVIYSSHLRYSPATRSSGTKRHRTMLASSCGLLQAGCSGYINYSLHWVPLLRRRMKNGGGNIVQRTLKSVMGCSARRPFGCISAASVGRRYSEITHEDEYSEEPFWLSLMKDFLRGIKSFFSFLIDQPRQLKYIEWPTFNSTLKTATLTLVLVALLIVALATVDPGLCYLLALYLRKKP